jgi:hypothetical protein
MTKAIPHAGCVREGGAFPPPGVEAGKAMWEQKLPALPGAGDQGPVLWELVVFEVVSTVYFHGCSTPWVCHLGPHGPHSLISPQADFPLSYRILSL